MLEGKNLVRKKLTSPMPLYVFGLVLQQIFSQYSIFELYFFIPHGDIPEKNSALTKIFVCFFLAVLALDRILWYKKIGNAKCCSMFPYIRDCYEMNDRTLTQILTGQAGGQSSARKTPQ